MVLKAAKDFIDDLQNIVSRYLIIEGFSVGIGDLVADLKTNDKIKNTIVKQRNSRSMKLMQQVHQQIFENMISAKQTRRI